MRGSRGCGQISHHRPDHHRPRRELTSQRTHGSERIPVHATDADGDALVYWADHLPPWATFAPATHTLNLNPDFASAGTYPGVTLYASDGVNTVSESFTLQIAFVPQPPVFTVPGPRTLREGDTFVTYFSASSPDSAACADPAAAVKSPTTGPTTTGPGAN